MGLDEPGMPHAVTNKQSKMGLSLFKSMSMAFCKLIAQVQNRRTLFHVKQMSGKKQK